VSHLQKVPDRQICLSQDKKGFCMKKKMVKLNSNQKSTDEVSEVYALLDVMKAIKIKESQSKQRETLDKKRLIKKPKIDS
jgi:hypothetical protein